jgi:hypothetical protein
MLNNMFLKKKQTWLNNTYIHVYIYIYIYMATSQRRWERLLSVWDHIRSHWRSIAKYKGTRMPRSARSDSRIIQGTRSIRIISALTPFQRLPIIYIYIYIYIYICVCVCVCVCVWVGVCVQTSLSIALSLSISLSLSLSLCIYIHIYIYTYIYIYIYNGPRVGPVLGPLWIHYGRRYGHIIGASLDQYEPRYVRILVRQQVSNCYIASFV